MAEDRYAYVLVEDEKWWHRRCTRNKSGHSVHSFVRRGKVGPKKTGRLLFYIKLPVRQIKGSADFVERITGSKDEIWNLYGSETVFENREEYDKFVGDRDNVTLIRFKDMQELDQPVSFETFYVATGIKKMPNGGMYLSRETLDQMI